MPPLPSLQTLSLAQQVAQMVVVRASGYLFDHQIQYPVWEPLAAKLQHWLQDLGVGGVILLGGSAAEVGLRVQQLQAWAKIPLLVSADIEEGVGQRFAGATWFPPPMALSTIAPTQAEKLAFAMGATTAQEAQAIGLNWVLAPVVDVNNNPANPVINVRSWGRSPEIVSQLATAFIRGAQQHSVLTTAKHFPGHGDTAVDSHLDLPVLPHSPERLAEVELPPFQAAIAAGVDAVMSAHLLIPALDASHPATLSHRILTGELREKLGFEGLIVTDALVMGAIADRYGTAEAAVLAVEAGADILLMPLEPEVAIQAVCQAVETGRIHAERIQASVERIWQAKARVCTTAIAGDTSHAWEELPPTPIQLEQLAQPAAIATVEQILQASMQVSPMTLEPPPIQVLESSTLSNVIVVDDALSCEFLAQHTPAIALPKRLGYQLQLIDRHTPPSLHASSLSPTLLQLFIRGNPFRGSAGLTQTAESWFHFLRETQQLQALVIYGSPYVLEKFLPELSADIPYVFTYGQMPAAQAIALQRLFSLEAASSQALFQVPGR
ncbi:MAG: beta-glucosidase [Scytolyngbya sp. HA4215-MV1]|nr:beta-glucosidase [Scytolyngbya sp. HA4215-MV1]